MRLGELLILGGVIMSMASTGGVSATPPTEYLSDSLDLIGFSSQGWGELGIDTCAHAQGQTPLKLQIRDKHYAKGIGHHAPGEIVLDLGGMFDTFEAEV